MSVEAELHRGWIDVELAEEFPELALRYATVAARPGRSTPEVKERLRLMSNRFTGGRAVHLRQEPIPWAYRVFFRHVGIDPDERRTPVEQFALDRMKHGAFKSRNLLDDGLLIATVETGVPVVAFDAERIGSEIGIRTAGDGELLGGKGGRIMSARQLVIADEDRSLAVLFGDMAEGVGVHSGTSRVVLCAVQVKGVPEIAVEEALWLVVEVLGAG